MITFIGLSAAAAGFCIAWYIQTKQQANKPLMCPRRSPCESVIQSPQAKTFGVSNTKLGLLYYAVSFFLFAYYATGESIQGTTTALLILVSGGLAFSLYLVGVQHFTLKQWCVWCLGSALSATVLFAAALTLFL